MLSEPSFSSGTEGEGSAGAAAADDDYSQVVFAHIFQKSGGWSEEQASGDRMAEVEQPIVVARWAANEHVLEHLLDRAGRTAVANEIGAEFAVPGTAEGHIVTQDLDLFAILDDRRERVMRRGRFDGIIQFNVGQLVAADDSLLCFGGKCIPSRQDREGIFVR